MEPAAEDHVAVNRAVWEAKAEEYASYAPVNWSRPEITWGIWHVPETEVGALPSRLAGLDVVELGCGTAYFSSWLARRGARPVGVDVSRRQLGTARRMQREHNLPFPLVEASAEAVPIRAERFDLALSEYGASLWCDPEVWLREAARLLRPHGRLVLLTNAPLLHLCIHETDEPEIDGVLRRDYFGMRRTVWPDEPGVEFHLTHGDWVRALRGAGFEILDLVELQAPPGARSPFPWVTAEWARRWPSEEIWVARRRPVAG